MTLQDWLTAHDRTATWLARRIDCVPSTVLRIVAGVTTPQLRLALRIVAECDGVTLEELMAARSVKEAVK